MDQSKVTESTSLLGNKKNMESLSPPAQNFIRRDFVTLIIYFASGVIFYSHFENLSVLRSLYFCVVTFTTVGYGDVVPTNKICKIFTCVFVLVGLGIVANIVSDLIEYIIEMREKVRKEKLHDAFDLQEELLGSTQKVEFISKPCIRVLSFEIPHYAVPIVHGLKNSIFIIATNIVVGIIFYSYVVDNFSLLDSMYISCMTITTVGYGDLTPSNNSARSFTILYALIGTLVTGNALSKFASAINDYKQAKLEATELSEPLSYESLMAMDVDKTNIGVSKEEFVLYKLKAMGVVDADILNRAEAQFHRLDVTKSGYLSIDDMVSFEDKLQRLGSISNCH